MNDHEIDALVAATAVDDERVASLPLDGLATELREQIMTTTDRSDAIEGLATPIPFSTRPPRRTPRVRRLAVAVTAVAAIVAGVGLLNLDRDGGSAYAAELVTLAEGSPRLLMGADGWEVTRVDELSADTGEMTFSNGEDSIDIHWRPASTHARYVADRAHDAEALVVTVAGRSAELFDYHDSDTLTALWLQGDHSVELRIDRTTEAEFRALVATVEAVGVETWLDALPESAIRPAERAAAVAELRQGIPVPAGFDESVWDRAITADRYQLGAHVAGAIACAWIDQWVAADAAGDETAREEAAAALATAREWPILQEMTAEGDFSYSLWEIADLITTDGVAPPPGGDGHAEGYVNALCLPR